MCEFENQFYCLYRMQIRIAINLISFHSLPIEITISYTLTLSLIEIKQIPFDFDFDFINNSIIDNSIKQERISKSKYKEKRKKKKKAKKRTVLKKQRQIKKEKEERPQFILLLQLCYHSETRNQVISSNPYCLFDSTFNNNNNNSNNNNNNNNNNLIKTKNLNNLVCIRLPMTQSFIKLTSVLTKPRFNYALILNMINNY